MYSIIEMGGKQYQVAEGTIISVEKLDGNEGNSIIVSNVLAHIKNDELRIGKPYLENIKVITKILQQGRGKKIRVFKYKAKSNYRRRQGHRQYYTKLLIEKIVE